MQSAPAGLKPMGVADILDAMFRLYRNNFVTFIGVAALAQLPLMVLQVALQLALGKRFTSDLLSLTQELSLFDPTTDSLVDLPFGSIPVFFIVSLLLTLLQTAVVQQLVSGALTNAIANSYLGRPTGILGAYQLGAGRFGALIVTGLLVTLATVIIGAVFFGMYLGALALIIGSIGGDGGGAIAGAIIGVLGILALLLVALVALLFVALRFLFITQAIVVEGHGPFGAIGRSWRLIRGSFWRTLGIYLLLSILMQIIVGIPVIGASFAINLAIGDPLDPFSNYALRQTLNSLVAYGAQIFVLPLQLTAFTLLYYDLRVRKEGYDLELRASSTADPAEL